MKLPSFYTCCNNMGHSYSEAYYCSEEAALFEVPVVKAFKTKSSSIVFLQQSSDGRFPVLVMRNGCTEQIK